MARNTKETGKKTSSMVMVGKFGLTVPCLPEIMLMERSKVVVLLPGLMEVLIAATFLKTIFMVEASISGLMEEYMMVLGRTIRCTDMASSHGPTEEDTMVNMKKIKNKVRELSDGLMEDSTSVAGSMVNSMDTVSISPLMEAKEKENGTKERG